MIVSEHEIQEFCDRLVKEFNPDKVILFGSYARGEQREWSDVDIMVVMPFEGRYFKKLTEVRSRTRPAFDLDLKLAAMSDLTARYKEFDPIARDVLDHGKILYDRLIS